MGWLDAPVDTTAASMSPPIPVQGTFYYAPPAAGGAFGDVTFDLVHAATGKPAGSIVLSATDPPPVFQPAEEPGTMSWARWTVKQTTGGRACACACRAGWGVGRWHRQRWQASALEFMRSPPPALLAGDVPAVAYLVRTVRAPANHALVHRWRPCSHMPCLPSSLRVSLLVLEYSLLVPPFAPWPRQNTTGGADPACEPGATTPEGQWELEEFTSLHTLYSCPPPPAAT